MVIDLLGGHCQNFGFYSRGDEELLKGSEQKSDMIWLKYFIIKSFKHTAKFEELYSPPGFYNILLYLLYHISTSIHQSYFLDTFQNKLQTMVYFSLNTSVSTILSRIHYLFTSLFLFSLETKYPYSEMQKCLPRVGEFQQLHACA